MPNKLAVAVGCSVSLLCLDQPHPVLEECPSTGHLRVDVHNHHVHLLSCYGHCFLVRDCLQFGILHDLVQSSPGESLGIWCLLFNCPGCVFLRWVLQLVGTRSLWRDCVCLVMSVESYSGFRTTPNVLIEHFHIPVTVVYVYNVCMCLCTCTCVCVIWWVCYLSSVSSIGYTHNNIGCVNHLVGVSIIWWVCPSCGVCP